MLSLWRKDTDNPLIMQIFLMLIARKQDFLTACVARKQEFYLRKIARKQEF